MCFLLRRHRKSFNQRTEAKRGFSHEHSLGGRIPVRIALSPPAVEQLSSLHLRRDLRFHLCLHRLPSRTLWPPNNGKRDGDGRKIPLKPSKILHVSSKNQKLPQLNGAAVFLSSRLLLPEVKFKRRDNNLDLMAGI